MKEIRMTHAGWNDEDLAGAHDTNFVIIEARDMLRLLRWAGAHQDLVEERLAGDDGGDTWLRSGNMQTVITEAPDGTPEVEMTSDGPCATADQQWLLTRDTVIPWEQALLWYCQVLMYQADMNATHGDLGMGVDAWMGKVRVLTHTDREARDASDRAWMQDGTPEA